MVVDFESGFNRMQESFEKMECNGFMTKDGLPPSLDADPFYRYSPSRGEGSADVWGFYEADTGSVQYIVADPVTKKAALIDVVLQYDPASGAVTTMMADTMLAFVEQQGLELLWILDTHPHADHFMASHYLHGRTGVQTGIGEKIADIAKLWKGYYNLDGFDVETSFDRLFADGDKFMLGELEASVIFTPGHTPGSITYVFGDTAFVHDTFMFPDSGTARADFPGGDVDQLWQSLQRLLELPDDTRLYVGHDYCSERRDKPQWEATVVEQRDCNIHLADKSEQEFKTLRTERDRTLELPARMLAALQVNLNGGRLPEPENDGERYLKIPLNRF